MTPSEELELFRVLRGSGGQAFEKWIAEQEAAAVKTLAVAEGAMLHRAQGRYGFIDEMKKLLDAVKKAR